MQQNFNSLDALPATDIEVFSDAQFVREPRLRLLQLAFHDLHRAKQRWAEIGVFGAQGQRMTHPGWRLAAEMANARMPRATLHDYQALQIDHAFTMALQLQQLIIDAGMVVVARTLRSPPQWCDLQGDRLGTRLHLEEGGAWLLKRFELPSDAGAPLTQIAMVVPQRGTTAVPVTCRVVPCTTALAHIRALERAELGRWALRQPAYCPLDGA